MGLFDGVAGGVLGGALGMIGTQQQNNSARGIADAQMQFQQTSNREAMAFSERMANTAHQREVEDLRKAGLNPILSATGGGGASAPGGVSSAGASAQVGNELSALSSSAANYQAYRLQAKQEEQAEENIKNTQEDTMNKSQDTSVKMENALNIQRDTDNKIKTGQILEQTKKQAELETQASALQLQRTKAMQEAAIQQGKNAATTERIRAITAPMNEVLSTGGNVLNLGSSALGIGRSIAPRPSIIQDVNPGTGEIFRERHIQK